MFIASAPDLLFLSFTHIYTLTYACHASFNCSDQGLYLPWGIIVRVYGSLISSIVNLHLQPQMHKKVGPWGYLTLAGIT